MITHSDEGPDFEPDDSLAVILRPPSDCLGPPPGRYAAIRRGAARRRVLRAAVGVGVSCAVAALIALPLHLATSETPTSPTVPLAPPPATSPAPAPSPPTATSPPPAPTPSVSPGPVSPRPTAGTRTDSPGTPTSPAVPTLSAPSATPASSSAEPAAVRRMVDATPKSGTRP